MHVNIRIIYLSLWSGPSASEMEVKARRLFGPSQKTISILFPLFDATQNGLRELEKRDIMLCNLLFIFYNSSGTTKSSLTGWMHALFSVDMYTLPWSESGSVNGEYVHNHSREFLS